MRTFLDTEKKAWVIGGKEYPVLEEIPMLELQWFRDQQKKAFKGVEDGTVTQLEALEADDEWWERICQLAFKCTSDEIIKTGISTPAFRDLMAEVYTFLSIFGTIEEAKQSPLYIQETQKKSSKQSKTTQT